VRKLKCSLSALAVIGLAGCEKYALDQQMKQLCAADGGVRVHEKVSLPEVMFDSNGDPFPGWRDRPAESRLGDDYRLTEETSYVKQGDPVKGEGQLRRVHWKVIRKSDAKVLGEGVRYGRSGGDFILLGHFTSSACPADLASSRAVTRAVFVKEGE